MGGRGGRVGRRSEQGRGRVESFEENQGARIAANKAGLAPTLASVIPLLTKNKNKNGRRNFGSLLTASCRSNPPT